MSEKGSEDSPPRPKRKIKKVMVLSSDSSSDSDDSVAVAGSRRKRLRVLSDEGSDSSGSSVVCAGARRKRPLPKLRDSEGDSDTSGWAATDTSDSGTDTSDWATIPPIFYVIGLGSALSPSSGPLCVSDAPKPASSATKPASGFASDSSEGNSDKCSICLLRFADQEVGTPQSCEHIFCLDCITEWSKNVNTCPVDRMTFDFIVVRACAGGRVLRTEPVKVVEPRPSVSTEDFLNLWNLTVCEVCGRRDIEETMLVCCMCDREYHMQCLTPPLSEVPMDPIGWFCPYCENLRRALISERRNIRSSRMSSADEPSTSSGNSGRRLHFDDIDPNNIIGYRGFWGNNTTSLNAVYGRLANRLLEDSD